MRTAVRATMAHLAQYTQRGSSNEELVVGLKRAGVITSPQVFRAMEAVDRGHYVPQRGTPYEDAPQPIGHRATISAPHMHAHVLELLADQLTEGKSVLDIGVGSGYLAACMARMVGPTGAVVGVDHIPELVQMSVLNLEKDPDLKAKSAKITIVLADGTADWTDAVSEKVPEKYDAIHVGAAAAEIPPPLIERLAPGGRLVVPVGPANGDQYLSVVDKDQEGHLSVTRQMGVRYVPLVAGAYTGPATCVSCERSEL
mmetsp:Transcript_21974/g.49500  ORF Transcript_21974/g.49500 Transcript_21974/m.49500 type:complete len:256 (+) Transcript_21974:11-778(+)